MPDRIDAALHDLKIDPREMFLQSAEQTRMAIVVVDPNLPDQPIVWVNRSFVKLTGYSREEVVGRNCRFLQGEGTEEKAVEAIRAALEEERVAVVDILNYRRDGTPFWNALHIGPIYDKDGKLTYFYGSQWDVTELIDERDRRRHQQNVAAELHHRTNNLFAVIGAIVRISAQGESDVTTVIDKIGDRIGALSRAHKASIAVNGQTGQPLTIRSLIEAVMAPYRTERDERVELHGNDIELPTRFVTPIGVALHELATNATKYGALAYSAGNVRIEWHREGDEVRIEWREIKRGEPDPNAVPSSGKGGTGSRIVQGVLSGIDATLESHPREDGYDALIAFPLLRTETEKA